MAFTTGLFIFLFLLNLVDDDFSQASVDPPGTDKVLPPNECESAGMVAELIQQALQGDVEAQYRLGELYYTGEGVEKNMKKAAKWYYQASKALHPEAQMRLGSMYYDGLIGEQNKVAALTWIILAAAGGSESSQTLYHIIADQMNDLEIAKADKASAELMQKLAPHSRNDA